jgi:hypothetical protein
MYKNPISEDKNICLVATLTQIQTREHKKTIGISGKCLSGILRLILHWAARLYAVIHIHAYSMKCVLFRVEQTPNQSPESLMNHFMYSKTKI